MKHILILFTLLTGCAQSSDLNDFKAKQDSINQINALRLDALEEEQTFQYKDIDSTKRALVWVGSVVMKHDSIIAEGKSGLARSQRRGLFWGQLIKTVLAR